MKEENSYEPNYKRIAKKIIKVLSYEGVTYRDVEIVCEYVYCELMNQRVQDSD